MKFKGIGPKRLQILKDAGYDEPEKIRKANFYDIAKLPSLGYATTYGIFKELGIEIKYPEMKEVTDTVHENVVIENKTIKPWRVHKKTENVDPQPLNFECEKTTVWSFKERGDWASHTAQYRGNWSPYVVRNIIELYSKPGDFVLDPMCGGGTTAVECLLTGRNSISCDINPGAISIIRDRLDLPKDIVDTLPETSHQTFLGDIRNMNALDDDSIDLVATHPPYVNIIRYAPSVQGDLSLISNYSLFFKEFRKAIKEMKRILKPGGYCAILIGDTHNNGHYVPVANRMMIDFLREGFILKEDVIKKEWNCESDHNLGKYANSNFLLTSHEHLYIFEKPNGKNYRNSSIIFFDE